MKVFCFIFSLYILFLSLQPCEEMTANVDLRVNKAMEQTQIDGQPAEKCDDCSPFCICACCHFSTAYQFRTFSVTGKITASAIFRANFSYRNPYSQAYKNPVWQPPKFNSMG